MKLPKVTKLHLLSVLVLAFLLIQLVPVETTNPAVESDIPASLEVKTVLRRACYDCHSNETRWPWYSRIAPISWQIAKDVREGREALNFSTWNRYDTKHRLELLEESWEEVGEGEMPPWFYLPSHRDAKLSERDKSLLRTWALSHSSDSPSLELHAPTRG